MRFAAVVLACVLAIANAQFNQGQYFPQKEQSGQYQKYNQYNTYNPYNPNNQFNNRYNQYNRYQNYNTYKPYASSTPFPPRPVVSVPEVPAPVVKVSSVPIVPVSPIVVTPAPVPFVPAYVAPKVAADARSAETVKYGNQISEDGAYSYFYETNNGIAAQAQGSPRNFGGNPPLVSDVAQGSFSWTSPEGEVIAITYVADENGYQPSGNAIPQPPPVPAQIARALEYIAKYAPVQSQIAASAAAKN